jgi:hypothetical protein
MVELMLQMIAAIPASLQSMMKMVKYVPGIDALMKPVMQVMMSKLMPSIFQKSCLKCLKP